MEFIIRRAKLEDLPTLTHIYNQAIQKGYCTCDTEIFRTEQRRAWFDEHNNSQYPLFTVTFEGKAVGYAYYSAYRIGRKAVEHVAEISYYLSNDIQGKGCGSFVMEYLLREAKNYGFSELLTILLANNDASIALLKKYGFELWGTLPDIVQINGHKISHLYYGKSLESK